MNFFLKINNSIKGIILMLMGQLSFAINDSIVKYAVKLTENDYSTLNIIFIRGVFSSLFIFIFIFIFYRIKLFKIFLNYKSYIRGIFEVLTALFFFAGLILMPMADVYTLLMTAPFMVTLYAFFFLKEKVGIRRWSAVIFGFIGVIIVINPQNLEFGFFFILPIISAFFLTVRDAVTKGFVNKENVLEITFITSILVMIFAGIGSLLIDENIKFYNLKYIIISSIFLCSGYLCSVLTIFYAPLSLTASIRYSVIVFGIILGYLLLGEVPSYNMIVGAIIISISGLFVIRREKKLGKIT